MVCLKRSTLFSLGVTRSQGFPCFGSFHSQVEAQEVKAHR